MASDKNKLNEPKVNLLIREIMKKKGVNAEQLAQMLGISENSVYVKLRGNITLNALYDIAQALDCEIADFFPVPQGYKHWTQVNESIETRKETYFCPKCGTKFQIND
jgi:DNA-binding Xre family transcriptional regulator